MKKEWIRIHEKDDVIVALTDIASGRRLKIDQIDLITLQDIPRGHKIALKDISAGESIIKYGHVFGIAKEDIKAGEHIHVHNVKTSLSGHLKYDYAPHFEERLFEYDNRTFKGFKRQNGDVGIRNEVWIVPTVGCVNGTAANIIKQYEKRYPGTEIPLKIWNHPYGCSQLGDDHMNTQKVLIDIIKHPNTGGVLVLGLGCENNHIKQLKSNLGEYDEERTLFLEAQKVGDEIEEGIKMIGQLVTLAEKDVREDVALSHLNIGLKCGGSDGLSGITANPLVGLFSDYMISQGAATILTEVPEMFGAETVLMSRAKDEATFGQIVNLIDEFKGYYEKHHQPIYENPSPGNKEGGITTLEDKSLGCIQKGGHAIVQDVLKYGERLKAKGLSLLEAPGNDLIASTALAASGCHMVLFTTGRGTPFGTFVPTVKISTNTPLFENKPHWIDFNAGILVDEESLKLEDLLEDFVSLIIQIASGEPSKNEINGYSEISIFKTGVTL